MIYIETYVKIVLVNMLWAYFTLVRDNDIEDKDIIPVSVITGFFVSFMVDEQISKLGQR